MTLPLGDPITALSALIFGLIAFGVSAWAMTPRPDLPARLVRGLSSILLSGLACWVLCALALLIVGGNFAAFSWAWIWVTFFAVVWVPMSLIGSYFGSRWRALQ